MSGLQQHHSNVARLSLASSRAIESSRLRFDESDEPVVTWLRGQVELISEEEMASAGGAATAIFFGRVTAVVPGTAAVLRPKRDATIQILIDALNDELAAELRNGSPDIVDELVTGARHDASLFYSRATEQGLEAPRVDVIPRQRADHAIPSECFVSAHVELGPPRAVMLYLDVGRVTDRMIAATPYVLFHELICHGLAGEARSGPRTCDPASPFSEGFMDHVAAQLHEQALESSDSEVQLGSCVPDRETARLWGRDYQASRYIVGGQIGSALRRREIEMRRIGRDTAAKVEQLFVAARIEPEFWKWALRLNASGLSHQERDDVVAALLVAIASETSGLAEQLAPLCTPDEIVEWTAGLLGQLP